MSFALPRLRARFVPSVQRLLTLVLLALTYLGASATYAQDDPPGRIGQLADIQGQAWLFDADRSEWLPAVRNRPLTSRDRIAIEERGRAVIRIGSITLRIAGDSELELQRVNDQQVRLFLHRGTLAVQVTSPEVASEIEVVASSGRFFPLSPGHYRFDRRGNETNVTTWSGALGVEGMAGYTISEGQRLTLRVIDGSNQLASSISTVALDPFSDWVAKDEQRVTQSYASQFVSPEMTGWEDLDRYGRWDNDPQYGALWLPSVVASGWAPYQFGKWIWMAPWGWTWVDNAPWGFAPFHYGRWVSVSGRWAWSPGQRIRRPTYSPALVTWSGRPHTYRAGHDAGPAVAWKPLAPQERYVPVYRASPTHQQNVDLPHTTRGNDRHTDRGRAGHGSTNETVGTLSGVRPGTANRSNEPGVGQDPRPTNGRNFPANTAPVPPPPRTTGVTDQTMTPTPPAYSPPASVPNQSQQNAERPSWRGDNGRRERLSERNETQDVERIRDSSRPLQTERTGQRGVDPVPQRPVPIQVAPPAASANLNPPVVRAPAPATFQPPQSTMQPRVNPPVAVAPPQAPAPATQQTRKSPDKGEKTDDGENRNPRRQIGTMER